MLIYKGGITSPKGFLANGIFSGIKKKEGRSVKDLAILFSQVPAICCGVFTTNKVIANPVRYSKEILKKNPRVRAIIVNSGNANSCTGERGYWDIKRIVKAASEGLGVSHDVVLAASTGPIGKFLPVELIINAMPSLIKGIARNGGDRFARGILTTDLVKKEIAVRIKIGKSNVTIGAVAKGSGMIHPHMATMLCFITTDANIKRALLKKALRGAVEQSFNKISVDADMSTNDLCLIMANGLAGNKVISCEDADYRKFCAALNFVTLELAKMIPRDGEGATKLIEVIVKNAKNSKDAKKVAVSVSNSNLVKTALFGNNPNFGRIASAVGASGAYLRTDRFDIYFSDTCVLKNGTTLGLPWEKLTKLIRGKDVKITVDLKVGKALFNMYTCDFSYDYVKINA